MANNRIQFLNHTERYDLVQLNADGCPSGAAVELESFQYYSSYRSPEGDLLHGQEGCRCTGRCAPNECSCAEECTRGLEALRDHGRASGVVSLLECGPACSCSPDCPAKTTQQGLSVQVSLQWNARKGWCVHAAQHINQGVFVCHYVGEYVTATEARRRLAVYDQDVDKGHALLTVRLQLPSQNSSLLCCIDATLEGNIARFINHSCDGGNLEAVLVTIKGYMLPRVALFAVRDIQQGEELSFAYCHAASDASDGGGGSSRRPCHCGTQACSGYLPSAL